MDVTVTARKSLYIRGLQAAHAGVLEVIDNAFHVAMYEFFPQKSKWERMDIEGSVYLARNNSSPLYSLIVLNKKGPTDLVLHVEESIEKMRIQEQYIMIQCRKGDEPKASIVGLWIHDTVDRERFFRSVLRIKEIRKNSPHVSALFDKFIQRSPSSDNVDSAVETSSPTALSKLTKKTQVASSTSADMTSSQMQVMVIPAGPTEGNNASASLLNILKSVAIKGSDEKVAAAKSFSIESTGTSSGNASLDDIIKKPDFVKASCSSPTKLTPAFKSHPTSNASVDFPTDGQISAKAKSRQLQQKESFSDSSSAAFKSLSTDATLVVEQSSIDSTPSTTSSAPSSVAVSTDALKALLSIGQGKIPSRSISDPVTLPEKASVSDLVSLDASSSTSLSTSPVTVTSLRETMVSSLSSEGYLSPKRLFPEYAGSKQLGLSSMSAKKVAKLISPADLGEVV